MRPPRVKRRARRALWLGALLALTASAPAPAGTWTIELRMQDAPDLRPFAAWNLYEIEAGFPAQRRETRRGGSNARVDWVAQLDGDAAPRRWHLEDSGIPFHAAATPDEYRARRLEDLRSPRIPADRPAFEAYPSAHRGRILWGHGHGWDATTIPALREDLARERAAGRPTDWLAFDACLMQTLEVATELAEQVDFITGSAQVQNFIGLPYRRLMTELGAGRADTPARLALEVPRWFHQSLGFGGLHSRLDARLAATETLSTIDTRRLRAEFLPAWDRTARALVPYLRERPLRRLRWLAVLSGNRRGAAGFLGGTQDLGVWLTSLQTLVRIETPVLSPAAEALDLELLLAQSALARSVPRYSLGMLYTDPEASPYAMGFRGVSLWQPTSREEWRLGAPDFARSRLYSIEAPAWNAVQAALFDL